MFGDEEKKQIMVHIIRKKRYIAKAQNESEQCKKRTKIEKLPNSFLAHKLFSVLLSRLFFPSLFFRYSLALVGSIFVFFLAAFLYSSNFIFSAFILMCLEYMRKKCARRRKRDSVRTMLLSMEIGAARTVNCESNIMKVEWWQCGFFFSQKSDGVWVSGC